MYQSPQPPLHESYYGPPIPPQPYRRPQRNCFCCLFSTLVKAFIAFCVLLAILILILWLVFRPQKIHVSVETASLTRFDLSTNPTSNLNYSLATAISLRNPNKRVGVYYDWLEADAYYDDTRFSWVPLPVFYQGHKNTTTLSPTFQGQSVIMSGNVGDFKRDNGTGIFNIDVWIYARVRYKFGSLITRRYFAQARCPLGLKLLRNGTANNGFTRIECDIVDY